jgi:4-hydroxy-2-oxoheptanedioate aldolase
MKSFAVGERRFSLGPFIKCPHAEMIESCALAGFDFAVVDMEHTPLGPRDLYPLVVAAERRRLDLVVRIPVLAEQYFKWCLDLGVPYIQVPHVNSMEDAERAVAYSYFDPIGERGLCRFTRAAGFSTTDRNSYMRDANKRTRLILQAEGFAALERIHEIVSVPGIDTLFIGPYDLSQSLGHPGEIDHPDVVAAIHTIIAACQKADVAIGTFVDRPEKIEAWVEAGVSLIEYGSDLSLFFDGARAVTKGLGGRS